jgi:hypothetical protein
MNQHSVMNLNGNKQLSNYNYYPLLNINSPISPTTGAIKTQPASPAPPTTTIEAINLSAI